jgi:hypothetical protein
VKRVGEIFRLYTSSRANEPKSSFEIAALKMWEIHGRVEQSVQDSSHKKIEEQAIGFARNLGTDNSEINTPPPVLCGRLEQIIQHQLHVHMVARRSILPYLSRGYCGLIGNFP